jgi:ATP-binding cassette subfamily B multidrug efflux pump
LSKKKTITSLLLEHKYSIIAGLLSLSVVDLAMLSIPLIIERVVDVLTIKGSSIRDLSRYAFFLLGLAFIMSFFRFVWRYFLMGAARIIEFNLRNEFFSHLQSLKFDFFSKRKTGDLMAHTVNDIEAIRMACGLGVLIAYDGVFLLIFILGAMLYVSPVLTLYAFIPFPILAIVIFKFGSMIEERFEKVQASFSDITEKAREVISGIKVVKAYVREHDEVNDFGSSSFAYLNKNLHLIKIWGVYEPLITFIAGISIVIFLWLGGTSAIKMGITLGDFAAILIYLTMLTWPMMAMGWAVDLIKRGNASVNRINDVLGTEPMKTDSSKEVELEVKGDIEFRNVKFSYNGNRVLKGVSLLIPRGTAFGITGGTASGKTTLVELLMRVIETGENQIFVDGVDVRKLRRESLRKGVVYIPQETTVFSGTIKDNISFMNPDLTDPEVIQASMLAGIYEEIMEFPGGFGARVGERGLTLSGGQRQRLALARAILLDPRVLILDDVLSSLDLKTEHLVLQNLRAIMKGNTLIAISSRVPSISSFDRIAVFEKGLVVELGSHEQLMAKKGIYESLYNVQMIR